MVSKATGELCAAGTAATAAPTSEINHTRTVRRTAVRPYVGGIRRGPGRAGPRRALPRTVASLIAGAVVAIVSFTAIPQASGQSYSPSDESAFRSLVNSSRSEQGLGTLAPNPGLDSVARAQASRMAERKAIYHNPNLESDATAAGVDWKWLGENVGVGYEAQSMHEGFMQSPGHHENIVFPDYDVIGVGVVKGDDGRLYVAHVFGTVEDAPAPAQVVSQPAPAQPAPAAAQGSPAVGSTSVEPDPADDATVESSKPVASDVVAVEGGVVNYADTF